MWRYGTLFTSLYIDVFVRLKHWLSDYTKQDMDCKVVLFLLTSLWMFSHVYFALKLIIMWRRWSVHVCLALLVELRHCSDLSLHIKQRQNVIYCLKTFLNMISLFHIKSTKAQCLLRYIESVVPFNVLSINWKQARPGLSNSVPGGPQLCRV